MSLSQFSSQQIQDFQEAFGLFDKDGDGYLSSSEIGVVIRSLGGVVTEAELQEMTEQFDQKSGQVDFSDFLALMASIMTRKDSADELLEAFQVFDRDGRGFISVSELRHLMTHLGEKLSNDDVDEMIKEADINGTGQVNYKEFVKMIIS
uniref:EF-hand domain-containing protein n=1 Tax=Arion vulgaris TaxID=1028688 RepID=A0A0B6Y689_9EUPU